MFYMVSKIQKLHQKHVCEINKYNISVRKIYWITATAIKPYKLDAFYYIQAEKNVTTHLKT